MDEIYLLWLLSISMLVCSFISGLVPMAFKMSENRSRLLALLGSGILVGTALAIIIPEGVDSLYGQRNHQHQVIRDGTHTPSDKIDRGHEDVGSDPSARPISDTNTPLQTPDTNMTWNVGASLIVGFLLMLLIDQFSIYQSGGHQHHYHDLNPSAAYEISKVSRQGNYTLASQDDDMDIGMEEEEDGSNTIKLDEASNEMKPIKNSGSHKVMIAASNAKSTISTDGQTNNSSYDTNPNSYYDHSRHISATSRILNAKVTPTLGLVIHAAADGIALGAAATTSHRDVEMIIFLAIMLHKAPAAFSLVVLLLHNGLKPPTIRRHLLAFSLSAPIAAIVTYYGLSQQGKEALRRNNATGVAMLFSAGTFLFVATVHVLPELIQNKLLTPREMMFLLVGAFLPLVLAQTV